MTDLQNFIKSQQNGILNIFFTAGYPQLNSTMAIARHLAAAGVELVEIGMPYSDPLADGATIQHSSEQALRNGMNLSILFEQVRQIKEETGLRIVLMGYLNQLLRMGEERFLHKCRNSGVDGLIIPDLPMEIYESQYSELFARYQQAISFLITPRTPAQRIRLADRLSSGFVYLVADNSITGRVTEGFTPQQEAYFKRIRDMQLTSPVLIGFGIRTARQFRAACRYAQGTIVGSEFIRQLSGGVNDESIRRFVEKIRQD